METVFRTLWPDAVAALSVAAGALLVARGVLRRVRERGRGGSGTADALGLVRSFRAVLVGAASVGIGVGLLADIGWLVALSLIIGGQELLETSIMAAALRDEERRRAGSARTA